MSYKIFSIAICLLALSFTTAKDAKAQNAEDNGALKIKACAGNDKKCLLLQLENEAVKIDNDRWRDQTFRELAKLLAHENDTDRAISLIEKIESADTKAMTIRGIGMAAAEEKFPKEKRDALFSALRAEAEKIEHPPSYGIALTYIAMAQAFAEDDESAMKTAGDMKNSALRNKAYGETGEIQAERGNIEAVMVSLAAIDSTAYRDKACKIISKIFVDKEMYKEALQVTEKIENAYQRSQSLLYILEKQITPEETLGK